MSDSVNDSQLERPRTISSGQWASNVFISLLPVLASFLAGGTQKWAEGMVVGLFGFYLLVRPPRISLGVATNLVLLALVALSAVAFLPASWFFRPAWRQTLVNDFGIQLPSTISPQPWITAGCLISFIAAIAWLYVVAAQEIGLRSTRIQLRFFVSGVVFLAAICIALYLAHGAFPFWKNERGFGPFPNRNHTADLFAISSIALLACGQDDLRHGRKTWPFWLVALAILIAAVIIAYSRAGILILVAGSAIWIVTVTLRQRSPAPIAIGVSFLLLLLTVLLLMGGQTLERFHLRGFQGTGIATDFRWRIFHDAFRMIATSPWCGFGFGNFESVFAIFRAESVGNTRALHPESDWIWLCSEVGWPAVVLVLIAAALVIRRVFPLREGTNQRFRLAALFAALLLGLHGIVDVPGHKVGTAFAAIFLLGSSLHRPLQLKRRGTVSVLFRVIGVGLLVSGIAWVAATQSRMLLPGSLGADNAKALSEIATRGRDYSDAIALTTKALESAPLDWQLYFSRAVAEVSKNRRRPALDDFRRARFLEPNSYEVPLVEGNIWMSSNPVLAVTAWREALRRAGDDRRYVYSRIVDNAPKDNPAISQLLEETGLSRPDLLLAYLGQISGASFDRALSQFLKRDPDLRSLGEPEMLALFALWSDRGDRENLARAVQMHPDWLQYAWLGMAKYYAEKKDFRAAYQLTQRFGEPAALPRASEDASLEGLNKRYTTAPDNFAFGYALYRKQMERGQIDDALNTARHFTERQNSPTYFHYLEAESWAAKGNWERAWKAWQNFWNAKAQAAR
jgi:O-antigen ligase